MPKLPLSSAPITSQFHDDSSSNRLGSPDGDGFHSPSEIFEERDWPLSDLPGSFFSLPAFEIPDLSPIPDVRSSSAIPPTAAPMHLIRTLSDSRARQAATLYALGGWPWTGDIIPDPF